MGIADRKLKAFIRPYMTKERNYAIFGKKLENKDSLNFNKFKDEELIIAKTIYQIYFTIFGVGLVLVITSLIQLLIGKEYWSTTITMIYTTFFIVYFTYFVFFVPYLWIRIYTRSWIKLLEKKDLIPKFTLFQKITGRYSSILYPKVKSYLETNNFSLLITEDEIRSVMPLSGDFDKIKRDHIKFDNSVIKFDDV